MTRSRSGIRSRPKHRRHPPAARRYRQTANHAIKAEVTFCVRGVISPLLANLFLHYAFDLWMRRNFPDILFERYADDAICHCRDEDQATALRTALATRFAECGLTLHPEKTKIVYCKDQSRRKNHPIFKFDFLGYTFRPRMVSKRDGGMGVSFSPAASTKALTAIRRTIRSWSMHRRSDKGLAGIVAVVGAIGGGLRAYLAGKKQADATRKSARDQIAAEKQQNADLKLADQRRLAQERKDVAGLLYASMGKSKPPVTGTHLWADRFDGSLEDVFELQEKVAVSVAGVIEPTLQAAETARSA